MGECCSPLRELECTMGMFGELLKHWIQGPPCTKCNGIHSLFKAACLTFLYYIVHSDLWTLKMVSQNQSHSSKGQKVKTWIFHSQYQIIYIYRTVMHYLWAYAVQPLFGEWFRNIQNKIKYIFKVGTDNKFHKNVIVWWQFSKDQLSLLTRLVAY